jgi:predicted secreted protein
MSWALGIAIYIVIWATVLFAVLPFGVRTQQEDGRIVKGSAESAPVNPRLGQKALATTIVSSMIFGAFYAALALGWLDGLVMPSR